MQGLGLAGSQIDQHPQFSSALVLTLMISGLELNARHTRLTPAALPPPCFLSCFPRSPLQAAVHHPLRNNGSRCYSRFFGWAYGDGALIPMYLSLCYWAAPCSAEACCALLLPAAVAAAGSILLGAAGQASRLLAAWFGPVETTDSSLAAGSSLPVVWVFVPGLLGAVGAAAASLWRLGVVLTAAALAYKLVDVVLDVARASTPVGVLQPKAL